MPKRSNDLYDKLPAPGSKPAIELESIPVDGKKLYRFTDYRAVAAYERFADEYAELRLDARRPALISPNKAELAEIRTRVKDWPVFILDPERAKYAPDLLHGVPHVDRHRFGSTGPMVRLYIAQNPTAFAQLSKAINERFQATPNEIDYVKAKIARGELNDQRCNELFSIDLDELEARVASGDISKAMLDKIDSLGQKAPDAVLGDIRQLFEKGQLTKLNCGVDPKDDATIEGLNAHDAYQLRRLGNLMATTAERARLLA
ncbi:MAG TPA: hypothetical protein VNF68_12415, partial [Candidatus Baltobacteraceae bacterium]|nr:hypothetical protein [Candidatus Baltobacteraceae bacterium]